MTSGSSDLQKSEKSAIIHLSDEERQMLMRKRQALIIELGALEEYLGMPRSIVPRRKR